MRIVVFVITAAAQLVVAAAGFLLLLLGLNGFGEREATPGLALYIVLSLASAVGLGAAAAYASKRLAERKSLPAAGAAALCVIGFSVAGAAVVVVLFFAAVLLAQAVRGMR